MSKFFLKENPELFSGRPDEPTQKCYEWIISADKIFSSEIDGLKDYARIDHIDFMIYKSFLFEEAKTAEGSFCAKEVHIYMPSGCHCAMLESRMAKNVIIPTITIKKIANVNKKDTVLEIKEFQQCVIRAFGIRNDIIGFAFRYRVFKDQYNNYDAEGVQKGSAAAQIDFVKWEIKES